MGSCCVPIASRTCDSGFRFYRSLAGGGRGGGGGGSGHGLVAASPGQHGGQQVAGVHRRVALLVLVDGDVGLDVAVAAHPLRRGIQTSGGPCTAALDAGQGPDVLREPDPSALLARVLIRIPLVDHTPLDPDDRTCMIGSHFLRTTEPYFAVGVAHCFDLGVLAGDDLHRVGRYAGADPGGAVGRHLRGHGLGLGAAAAQASGEAHRPHQDDGKMSTGAGPPPRRRPHSPCPRP